MIVADGEAEELAVFHPVLKLHGHDAEFVRRDAELVTQLNRDREADLLVVLEIVKQHGGLEVLKKVRQARPDAHVIVLSQIASPSFVVAAMKHGANDFLQKPVNEEELGQAFERARGGSGPLSADGGSRAAPGNEAGVFSRGAWSRRMEPMLERAGAADVPLLFRGETGVGKEVLARRCHARSARSERPFLKLNCAALPSELIESELFGYERGAFTGAVKSTAGKFEMANNGTILLDEIGDMDFKLQAKLLQVLQDKEFMRLGSAETLRVDVRVMAATHKNLEDAITAGTFRQDLFYRLNVIEIHIPPLRERVDEILPLAEFLLKKHSAPGRPLPEIPGTLRRALLEHPWPGNIRELENVIRKFVVLGSAAPVVDELLRRVKPPLTAHQKPIRSAPAEAPAHPQPTILANVNAARKAAESEAILNVLNSTRWNRKEAAKLLGIEYKALLYKMKKLGIGDSPDNVPAEMSQNYSASLSDRFIA